MNKYIVVLMSLAFLGTSCKKKYEEGFAAGEIAGLADGRSAGQTEGYNDGFADGSAIAYETGFAEGEVEGYNSGFSQAETYFATAGYSEGFADATPLGTADGADDGYDDGYTTGYDAQFIVGQNEGTIDGQVDGTIAGAAEGSVDGVADGSFDGANDGYNDGYDDGYANGFGVGVFDGETDIATFDAGYADGYDDFYGDAYLLGEVDGAIAGADDGYADGYDLGFDDGYDASYGLNKQSDNPVVKLAIMVNKDLIDYDNMEKFNTKTAAASLGMADPNASIVDMEKVVALKEAHYLNQMATQLKTRYGLNSKRSFELAKVVHQFNKLAGTRELTDEDANAFAKNAIGTSLKNVDTAVRASLKGNGEMLNTLVENVAAHNETSAENVNAMISQLFF
jgi:hypothetical protein